MGWRRKAIYIHDDSWTAHFLSFFLSLRSLSLWESLSSLFFRSPSLSFLSVSPLRSLFFCLFYISISNPRSNTVEELEHILKCIKFHFSLSKNMINCCFFPLFDSVSTSFIFWLFTTSPKRQQKSSFLEFVTVKKFSHSLLSVMFVFSPSFLSLSFLSLSLTICVSLLPSFLLVTSLFFVLVSQKWSRDSVSSIIPIKLQPSRLGNIWYEIVQVTTWIPTDGQTSSIMVRHQGIKVSRCQSIVR